MLSVKKDNTKKDKSLEIIFLAILAALSLAMGEVVGSVFKG